MTTARASTNLLLLCFFLQINISRVAGQEPLILNKHNNKIVVTNFSIDGSMLATGSIDGKVMLWDMNKNKLSHELVGHSKKVTSCVFSQDGKYVATGSWDASIIIWSTETGKQVKQLRQNDTFVLSIIFGNDNRNIYSANGGTSIISWDCDTGKIVDGLTINSKQGINSINYMNTVKCYVTTCNIDGTICIWDDSGKLKTKLNGHDNTLLCIACSNDGKMLASAGEDMTLKLWNLSEPKNGDILSNDLMVLAASFNSDNSLLATAVAIKESKIRIHLWNIKQRKITKSIDYDNVVSCVCFCSKTHRIAAGTSKGELLIYDISK